jgi:peptidoglycan hydrolase-like protein with peptidoglycan-binding domain
VTEVEIPAKYQDKRVKRLLAKAMQSTIAIPAVTREVNKRVKTTDARLEWRPVLCETNTTQRTISKLQQALSDTGYHVGDINGEMTHDTQSAIEQFQRANGMATGGLTLEVLNKLGISPG